MDNGGWIKIHRKLQENPIWDADEPFDKRSAWIDLLIMANHKDSQMRIGNEIFLIKMGSTHTSELKLMDRWKWSRKKVRSFLLMLKNAEMVTTEGTAKGTTITIVNYEKYQHQGTASGTAEGTPKDTTQDTAKGTQTRSKEREEGKNITSPTDEVVEEWNKLPEPVKKVSKITKDSARDRMLRKRIADFGIGEVKRAIANIRQSDFLQGGGNKGWTISFDWFVKPENFQKVLEGNYNDRVPPEKTPDEPQYEVTPELEKLYEEAWG